MAKRTFVILAALTVIFIILGAVSIWMNGATRTHGSFEAYNNDDVKYLRSARIYNETGVLVYNDLNRPTVFIMPGIILILSPFVAVFGEQGAILPFKIFQLFLSAGSLWIIFLIARRAVGEKAALVTAGLCVLYVADYYAVNIILTEVIFRTLFLTLVYITMVALNSKKLWHYILGGVVFAMAVYFRPTIAMYPLIILVMWIRRKYTLVEMLKFGGAVTAVFVLLMSPWWVRNYQEFGRFIPLTLSSGNPMLQGTYIHYKDDPKGDAMIGVYETTGNEIDNDAVEKQKAWDRIRTVMPRKPLQYFYWYTIGKMAHLWGTPFVWTNIFGLSDFVLFFQHVVYTVLFAAGAWMYFKGRHRNINGFLLGLVLVYFTAIHLPFYAFERYVYPAMPCVTIFAAWFLINHRKSYLER